MRNNTSVMQGWTVKLNHKAQTGLISAIRGCDEDAGEIADLKKLLTREIRFVVLRNADKHTTFMSRPKVENSTIDKHISTLQAEHKKIYSLKSMVVGNIFGVRASSHWFDHVIKALSIIANNHPDNNIRYWAICIVSNTMTKEAEKRKNKYKIK